MIRECIGASKKDKIFDMSDLEESHYFVLSCVLELEFKTLLMFPSKFKPKGDTPTLSFNKKQKPCTLSERIVRSPSFPGWCTPGHL